MPKGSKVLIVDDDRTLLSMYKERLDLAGYKIELAHNGEEALAKVHEVNPDIVLLDLMIPKMNGFDVLASLRSEPGTKDLPVIILSALMKEINKEKTLQVGADDYILKAEVVPSDLIGKIEEVLEKRKKKS